MSTNGQITFVAGGHAKRSYSHCDNQPSGLGLAVLRWPRDVMGCDHESWMRQAIEALVVVGDFVGSPPTSEQTEALAKYCDPRVGGEDEHWYRLLRKTQGRPDAILRCGYSFDQYLGTDENERRNYVIDADQRQFRALGRRWSFDSLPTNREFLLATRTRG
jgi:hypothetical protein